MKFDDAQALKGELVVRVWRRGELLATYADRNMIMLAAKDALARLIAGDGAGKTVTKIGFGTDGRGPSPDDAALTGAYVKALTGHAYPEVGQVRFDWRLDTTEANGMGIREFGLITADDVLFARKTRAVIEKDSDISLDGTWTIIF